MPYHLNKAGDTVLQEDGKPVPGGKHKNHEEALKHLQALEVNVPEAHSVLDKVKLREQIES